MNIAWLLHKSPLILPIPGTTSINHLKENIAAAEISISKEDMNYLG
ncbi:aldo/keto reductase [Pedobacter jamesrossensis]|uniref:Aldo/keto reductase n=1 Tax=Pedobacter jamesrossensis TaxID=1908238 RepID=A0ABV8NLS3_9SPHI